MCLIHLSVTCATSMPHCPQDLADNNTEKARRLLLITPLWLWELPWPRMCNAPVPKNIYSSVYTNARATCSSSTVNLNFPDSRGRLCAIALLLVRLYRTHLVRRKYTKNKWEDTHVRPFICIYLHIFAILCKQKVQILFLQSKNWLYICNDG